MLKINRWTGIALCALALPLVAHAQTVVKIGFISTFSGPEATAGAEMDRGVRLYMKLHAGRLPPGVKVELITRDDAYSPEKDRQLAQELIVRDKVQFLTGVVLTPGAIAIAPLVTEARVPFVLMNSGGAAITTLSPYIARVSFTFWQSVYPLGQWSARHYKRAFIAVSDFAAGYDCEAAFERGFTEGGGTIVGKVRMPLANPDFVPFMQRVKDSNPEILFSFIPAGVQTTQVMKAFGDLGLGKAGIRFLGTGDIVDDEQLPKMGDIPVGVISAHHYSTAGERPANTAFLKAWHEAYGPDAVPDFIAVAGYDGMDAIYTAIREQDGRIDPERSMAILRNYRNPDSPRGSISIDSKTRDIVQNIYIRETRKTPRGVANVEIETLPDMADPWKRIFGKE